MPDAITDELLAIDQGKTVAPAKASAVPPLSTTVAPAGVMPPPKVSKTPAPDPISAELMGIDQQKQDKTIAKAVQGPSHLEGGPSTMDKISDELAKIDKSPTAQAAVGGIAGSYLGPYLKHGVEATTWDIEHPEQALQHATSDIKSAYPAVYTLNPTPEQLATTTRNMARFAFMPDVEVPARNSVIETTFKRLHPDYTGQALKDLQIEDMRYADQRAIPSTPEAPPVHEASPEEMVAQAAAPAEAPGAAPPQPAPKPPVAPNRVSPSLQA